MSVSLRTGLFHRLHHHNLLLSTPLCPPATSPPQLINQHPPHPPTTLAAIPPTRHPTPALQRLPLNPQLPLRPPHPNSTPPTLLPILNPTNPHTPPPTSAQTIPHARVRSASIRRQRHPARQRALRHRVAITPDQTPALERLPREERLRPGPVLYDREPVARAAFLTLVAGAGHGAFFFGRGRGREGVAAPAFGGVFGAGEFGAEAAAG